VKLKEPLLYRIMKVSSFTEYMYEYVGMGLFLLRLLMAILILPERLERGGPC
jgi:hypothetical protein